MEGVPYRFKYLGRSWHAVIPDGEALSKLPLFAEDALWIATAAPLESLEGDKVFYQKVDIDGDGRIRSDELRASVAWLFSVHGDPKEVRRDNTTLKLESLRTGVAEADKLRQAALSVAEAVKTPLAGEITLAQVRQVEAEENAKGLSEAGWVLPKAAVKDAALQAFLEHVVEGVGGETHPSGSPAVSEEKLVKFLDEAKAWLAWHAKGELAPGATSSDILPLGPQTADGLAAMNALSEKMDQYFLLCDAVHLDPKLAEKTWPDGATTDLLDPVQAKALLAKAPLTRPRPDGRLDVGGALNPAFSDAVGSLNTLVLKKLFADKQDIDRAVWAAMKAKFQAYNDWIAGKPVTNVGARAIDVIRDHAENPSYPKDTRDLLAESHAASARLVVLRDLEKLILFQAYMLPLVNSFVSHPDLYDLHKRAAYEMGVLILDGRRFNLAVKVPDAARHEKFTAASAMFVMYVMVGDKGSNWQYQICVPVTAGDRGTLVEGMWGIFVDFKGHTLHAQVRKVIANPISIHEAIFAPVSRIAAALQAAVDKQAAAQDAALTEKASAKATAGITTALTAPQAAAAAAAAPPAPAVPAPPAATPAVPAPQVGSGGTAQMAALAATGGIALAAIGSFFTYLIETFFGAAGSLAALVQSSALFKMMPEFAQNIGSALSYPLSVLAVFIAFVSIPLLAYLVPVVLSAWLKLRRRDLSALLEGSGWAINQRMYITKDLAKLFTQKPKVSALHQARKGDVGDASEPSSTT